MKTAKNLLIKVAVILELLRRTINDVKMESPHSIYSLYLQLGRSFAASENRHLVCF